MSPGAARHVQFEVCKQFYTQLLLLNHVYNRCASLCFVFSVVYLTQTPQHWCRVSCAATSGNKRKQKNQTSLTLLIVQTFLQIPSFSKAYFASNAHDIAPGWTWEKALESGIAFPRVYNRHRRETSYDQVRRPTFFCFLSKNTHTNLSQLIASTCARAHFLVSIHQNAAERISKIFTHGAAAGASTRRAGALRSCVCSCDWPFNNMQIARKTRVHRLLFF